MLCLLNLTSVNVMQCSGQPLQQLIIYREIADACISLKSQSAPHCGSMRSFKFDIRTALWEFEVVQV